MEEAGSVGVYARYRPAHPHTCKLTFPHHASMATVYEFVMRKASLPQIKARSIFEVGLYAAR